MTIIKYFFVIFFLLINQIHSFKLRQVSFEYQTQILYNNNDPISKTYSKMNYYPSNITINGTNLEKEDILKQIVTSLTDEDFNNMKGEFLVNYNIEQCNKKNFIDFIIKSGFDITKDSDNSRYTKELGDEFFSNPAECYGIRIYKNSDDTEECIKLLEKIKEKHSIKELFDFLKEIIDLNQDDDKRCYYTYLIGGLIKYLQKFIKEKKIYVEEKGNIENNKEKNKKKYNKKTKIKKINNANTKRKNKKIQKYKIQSCKR